MFDPRDYIIHFVDLLLTIAPALFPTFTVLGK